MEDKYINSVVNNITHYNDKADKTDFIKVNSQWIKKENLNSGMYLSPQVTSGYQFSHWISWASSGWISNFPFYIMSPLESNGRLWYNGTPGGDIYVFFVETKI